MPPRTPVPPSPPPRAAAPPPEPPPVVQPEPPPPEPEPEDILDLTEQMAEAEHPSFQTIDGQSDVIFADPAAATAAAAHGRAAARIRGRRRPPRIPTNVRSCRTRPVRQWNSAFNSLAQTVLVQNARTLEDLVREMLRPLLKSWLDDNLPGMVERIVKAEIERVSRGRGQ